MKVYTTNELKLKEELKNDLTFEITDEPADGFEGLEDDDAEFWITFYDGGVYDGGDISYLFQDDLPSKMYEIVEGVFSYEGSLSKSEVKEILIKIGFNE